VKLNYIAVVGYNWTGASVVVDLLREFDDYEEFGSEFCLIWEKDGILDLEMTLFNNWEVLSQDVAVNDFLEYIKIIQKRGGKFTKWGIGIDNILDINLFQESKKYIDELTEFKYKSNKFLLDYKLPYLYQFFNRLKRKKERILKQINVSSVDAYFTRPGEEKFLNATRNYMDSLFYNFSIKNNAPNIILDQALPASNLQHTMRYFHSMKTVVIDRDPRDVYLNLIKRKMLIGLECSLEKDSVNKFISWYKIIRENKREDDKNILRLNFEDIVLNYDDSLKRIKNFLDIKTKHSKNKTYFNPEKSKKNIGLWKTHANKDDMRLIYQELKQYCNQGS
jgi:hypothetical protein